MNFLKQGLIEEDRKLKEKMKQEVQRNLPKNYGTPPAPIVKTYPPKTVPQNYGTLPTKSTSVPVFMLRQPTGIELINQQIDTGTLPNLPKKEQKGISTGRVGQFLEGINKGGIGGIMNLIETAEKDLNYRMYNKALEAGYPKAAEKYKKRLDDITNNSVSAPLIERGQQATLKAKEGLGGVGSTLVDVGTSIGNNLQAIGAGMVTGINPLAIMAFQSGGQSAYEAAQKGATPSQQLTKGIVSGAIEAATEKLPLEGLTRLVKEGGKAGVKQLLKRLLQQGLTEAAEEAVSYIANNAAGKVILGDLEDDFDLKELGYSALLGGISGGVMGGGAASLGAISQANYQKAGGDDVWGNISEWQKNKQFGQNINLPTKTDIEQLNANKNINLPTEEQISKVKNYGTLPTKAQAQEVNLPPTQTQNKFSNLKTNDTQLRNITELLQNPYVEVRVIKAPQSQDGTPIFYRRDNGENLNAKAQGIYVTPSYNGNFYSVHQDAGNSDRYIAYNPQNTLEVKPEKAKTSRGVIELSAGASALKVLNPNEFDIVSKMNLQEIKQYAKTNYPNVNLDRFSYDPYEIIEILGAENARAKGYDSIYLNNSNDISTDEVVLLNDSFKEILRTKDSSSYAVPKPKQSGVKNYGTLPTKAQEINLPPTQAETQQSRVNVPTQQETSVKGQETPQPQNADQNKPLLQPEQSQPFGTNTVGAAEHNPSSYDALLNKHGAIPPGENPVRNVDVPVKSADGRNVRRLSRTVMEAEIMPNEMVSDLEKEIASGRMSYDVISDKSAEDYANRVIKENGFNGALQFWDNIINGNGRIDKNTFALGQVLLNQAMTNGDTTLAMKLISELGVASTIGGQITQANRMIKKMTPDGRLYHLEVAVKKINQEALDRKGGKAQPVKIDENLAKDLLNSQTQEEVEENAERIEQDIADQLDVTFGEKLEHWRYTGMLGSIKTHVRNIIGNASMYVNKQIKDKIGAVMEKALPKSKRTKSFTTNKADRAFAEADFNEFSDAISGEGKYNTKQGIMSKRVIYKTRELEWLRKTNLKFLEMEDVFFLKANYISSFAQAMKARGLTAEFLKSGTPESNQQLAELREYATSEAQRATFRDASALANALSRLEKSGKGGAFLVKGHMPFKKVPINILRRGVGYSPVGIIKGTYDTLVSVRNGTKTATQAIDTLSAGLTGTGIMALGAFLASAGLIVGGKDDDDRYQSFEALQGSQNYAIKFMGKTYTIDWLAPTSIPLMAGVELFNDLKNSEGFTITKFFDSLSKISEPAFELSTLQGLNNTIKSAMYNPDNPLSSMLARIAQNYVGQFFPTILGQAARTIDENRRSVYVDKNAPIPAFVQETSQRLMSKIPGASFPLSPMVDLWGRELKGEENVALRAFENFISPGYLEGDKATALDREIDRLYKKTGNKSVIPRKADKYFQVDGKRLDLTQGQYYRYAKAKGQMSYEYADKIRKNPAYAKLSDAEKSDVISSAYEYANARAKTQVSDYKLDGWHAKAEKAGIMIDDYLILRAMLPENPKKAEVSATANKISPQKAPKLVELYYSKLDKD